MTISDAFSERDLRAFGIYAEVTAEGHLLRVVLSHDDLDRICTALRGCECEEEIAAAYESGEEVGYDDGYSDAMTAIKELNNGHNEHVKVTT